MEALKRGSLVCLSENGRNLRLDELSRWRGIVMSVKGEWARVLWTSGKEWVEHVSFIESWLN